MNQTTEVNDMMNRDAFISERLTPLCDGTHLLAVESGIIPAPPSAGEFSEHLLVNCVYRPDVAKLSADAILSATRSDALRILRLLRTDRLLDGIASVCITFYSQQSPGIPRRRLYRYSRLTSALPADVNGIDESLFAPKQPIVQCIQSSELEAVADLLNANR